MFNSVEFVLVLLSMFSSMTQENRTAVLFLLDLALGYVSALKALVLRDLNQL
jgi:hypothetical protein